MLLSPHFPPTCWGHSLLRHLHIRVAVPSYEMSSPWHWPKLERAPGKTWYPMFLLMSGTDNLHFRKLTVVSIIT